MLTTSNIRNIYEKIQKQLFYMIPEKWDRVYLYASVVDHFNGLQTGEMFFYYFPKSIIKKNPINVYEVPSKFNLDEGAYLKLAEKLYDEIKFLREELIKMGEKPWTNVTISIENFKFNVEYNYENLQDTKYTNYDRHLIWRYQYLDVPLSSYSKKERKMIEEYLSQSKHNNKPNTYQEGIYKKPVSNIKYNKHDIKEKQYIRSDDNVGASPVSAHPKNNNKSKGGHIASPYTAKNNSVGSDALVDPLQQQNIKSQILNINNN